ncbi:FHA domain containing protein [Diplocarpon rosae]|nr:FHA domain containing protein [Diplocarpon rosae]
MYSAVPSSPQWNQGPLPALERIVSASSPPPAAPTSPTRTGRLRGLSYLRSYTQNHILSRESHNNNTNTNHIHNHGRNSAASTNLNTVPDTSNSQQRPSTLGRATSYPSPTSRPAGPSPAAATPRAAPQQAAVASANLQALPAQHSTPEVPFARSSNQDSLGNTSGWLPTVGGFSAVSRIASEPQSTATGSSSAVLSGSNPSDVTSDLTASMARTRSATTPGAAADRSFVEGGEPPLGSRVEPTMANGNGGGMAYQLPSIRFSAHQDPRAQRPSLVFPPTSRILPTGRETIKVGRYSERDTQPSQAANIPSAAPVGFKSKVVSRRHCEFWCSGGRWFIKDVKSSSGTFLNHIRLSSPGTESRPFPVNDGDIVQLGIDFKGGEEMIFRCVKIRVELNKGWQHGPSSFNVQSHKRLRELNNLSKSTASGTSQDCSICLGPIAPCQSLFVAPCSHTWHYKCIRVIINGPHWPHFICPNCRTVADLEAELDDPYANGDWEEVDNHSPPELPHETETAPAVQEPPNPQDRQATLSEGTGILVDSEDHSEPDHSSIDLPEGSDDSGIDQGTDRAANEMSFLNIDEIPSPPGSHIGEDTRPNAEHISNATSPPVNIARKAVGSRPSQLGRRSTRTPSPNGLSEQVTGTEGPMTPRNDIGPFVLDGSAGRSSEGRLAELAPLNLDHAANTPLPTSHPA